jgi:hypothetical protein
MGASQHSESALIGVLRRTQLYVRPVRVPGLRYGQSKLLLWLELALPLPASELTRDQSAAETIVMQALLEPTRCLRPGVVCTRHGIECLTSCLWAGSNIICMYEEHHGHLYLYLQRSCTLCVVPALSAGLGTQHTIAISESIDC